MWFWLLYVVCVILICSVFWFVVGCVFGLGCRWAGGAVWVWWVLGVLGGADGSWAVVYGRVFGGCASGCVVSSAGLFLLVFCLSGCYGGHIFFGVFF